METSKLNYCLYEQILQLHYHNIFTCVRIQIESDYINQIVNLYNHAKAIKIIIYKMSSFYRSIFTAFTSQLKIHKPKAYYSTDSIIQSSVGLIFRVTPFSSHLQDMQKVQILYTQRAGYITDRNAYNIVFPGGQADKNQSDYEACIRQLIEQINLNPQQDCIYLGQIPQNFYYMKKNKYKSLFMTCHAWKLKNESWQPRLNESQLSSYKWVDIQQIYNQSNYSLSSEIMAKSLPSMIKRSVPKLLNIFTDRIISNLQNIQMPVCQLGMNRQLWGLTLWLQHYFMQMIRKNLQVQHNKTQQNLDIIKKSDKICQKIQKMEINFKPGFILGYPIKWSLRNWNRLYRKKPFTYQRSSNSYSIKKVTYWLVLIVLIYIIFKQFYAEQL